LKLWRAKQKKNPLGRKKNPCGQGPRKRNPEMSDEASELELFADNTESLYKRKLAIIKVILERHKLGRSYPRGDKSRWRRYYRAVAVQYKQEIGPGQYRFLVRHMNEAADEAERYERKLIESGEYDWLIKGPVGTVKKNVRRLPKRANPKRETKRKAAAVKAWEKAYQRGARKTVFYVVAYNGRTDRVFWYTVGDRFSPYDYLAAPFSTVAAAFKVARQHAPGANEIMAVISSTWSKQKLLSKLRFSFGKPPLAATTLRSDA
jgi:hypothetical protein